MIGHRVYSQWRILLKKLRETTVRIPEEGKGEEFNQQIMSDRVDSDNDENI